jgi:hypothetical protein
MEATLRAEYRRGPTPALAAALGKSIIAVRIHARRLGLSRRQYPRTRWTPERDALLRALAGLMPTEEVAVRLGTSRAAILNRAHALGLRWRANGYHRATVQAGTIRRLRILLAVRADLISPAAAARALGIEPVQVWGNVLREALRGAKEVGP